jgi:putative nucleotidyltransferase with HDIG domain
LFKQHQIQQLIEEGEVVPRSPLPQEWMGAILTGENGPLGVIAALNYQDEPVYSEKELAVLNFVADQAQLLIQRKKSEERVRQANLELSLAYDSTLEGWSRALEMRERETAGHSQRVVSLTLGLAKALGLSDEELVHIRRGALLHDIGKMGIPDHILLKPGKLTDDEWNIMRQHPIYAYQLLAPIQYLAPALDIPYAHHERWDGSGYRAV